MMTSSSSMKHASAILKRGLAAQAASAPKPVHSVPAQLEIIGKNSSICTIDLPSSHLSLIGVVLCQGSSLESYENGGITHALKCASGLSCNGYSNVATTRHLQQIGSTGLNVESDRQHLYYSCQFLPEEWNIASPVFFDSVLNPLFNPWETRDVNAKIKMELNQLSSTEKTIELLHRAAYRQGGLGNSIYCPTHLSDESFKASDLTNHFSTLTNSGVCVVGVNVKRSLLKSLTKNYLETLGKNGNQPQQVNSKFHAGSEIRADTSCKKNECNVVLSVEGVSVKDMKSVVICNILKHILGGGSKGKYCSHFGRLGEIVNKSSTTFKDSVCIESCNRFYHESGLFGACIKIQGKDEIKNASEIVKSVADTIRSLSASPITKEELERGKRSLEFELRFKDFRGEADVAKTHAMQATYTRQLFDANALSELVQSVSLSEVKALSKKMCDGGFSMASSGNLSNIPYVDQI